MSGLEFNKFFASILIAIIIFVIIGYFANFLVDYNKSEDKETAYLIEIPENPTTSNLQTDNKIEFEEITPILANASLKNGEKVSKKCGTCHNYEKDSKSKVGPNLWDLINRKKGGISGFAYSKALVDYGGEWTYEELNGFLYKPKEYIPGTKMNFAGLKNVQDRADIILWLRQFSDNPIPLP